MCHPLPYRRVMTACRFPVKPGAKTAGQFPVKPGTKTADQFP